MENNSYYLQITTAVAKKFDAECIAKSLSEKKLSACTQIVGPITSIYRWKGKLEKSKEWLCIIKTKKDHYQKIERMIKEIHPYELPEVIAIPIIKGSREYLDWISKEV